MPARTVRPFSSLDSHTPNSQVFTSSDPGGSLLVADFASIESRALAYQAGETWKVDAYHRGEDIYKAQAVKIFRLSGVDVVTKEQRTTGKVGELSCGYGAGPVAVKDFAAKMHVEMSESEAGKLVRDWRDANPKTVDLWERLLPLIARHELRYHWVKGHAENAKNNRCDQLAVAESRKF